MDEEQKDSVAFEGSVRIDEITFNDETKLQLHPTSIVVFTGSNNCGKSQTLKDVMFHLTKNTRSQAKVVTGMKIKHEGILSESFFEGLSVNTNGKFHFTSGGGSLSYPKTRDEIVAIWEKGTAMESLYDSFFRLLDTESRLTTSKSKSSSNHTAKDNALITLSANIESEEHISKYFKKAFNEAISLYKGFGKVSLHVGDAVDRKSVSMREEGEYYRNVQKNPILDLQGDGMRSFATILLELFNNEHSVMLIDEPESFLHPPQARIAGNVISQSQHFKGQLFISTHSEDFIQGLLDSNSDNVTVVRIDREGNTNHMHVLKSEDLKELWKTPILRYSNVFKGIFHDKVIVCEGDRDCLFYQALIDSIYEQKDEIAPNILYTHCGGKDKIKDVVKVLGSLKVPTIAILDLDILSDSRNLKSLVESMNGHFSDFLPHTKVLYDWVNKKQVEKSDSKWFNEGLKEQGIAIFTSEVVEAFRSIDTLCKNIGLYMVPVGELECFYKCNQLKQNWVYHMLENYDFSKAEELKSGREFVQSILAHKFQTEIPTVDTMEVLSS